VVGVRFGVFTVTESAAVAAIYALVVTGLGYRSLTWATFRRATLNAVRTTSLVMIVIGTGNSVSWLLALHQLPQLALDFLTQISSEPWVILLLINIYPARPRIPMDMAPLILICTPISCPS
jgi:TRAP-type C4-dicarboxylate transport system permease large subunit